MPEDDDQKGQKKPDDQNKPDDKPDEGKESKPEPKLVTQEEVDRIAAREKQQGRQAAINELSEQLGVSVDEAKEIIEQHRQREESEKSEAQKSREAADREKAEAEASKAIAARERHEAKLERLFVRAGVQFDPDDPEDDRLGRVMRLATVEDGADDDALRAEVDAVKEKFPELFKSKDKSDDDGKGKRRTAPSGDPKGASGKRQQKTGDSFERGRERARKRFGKEKKEPASSS